MMYLRTAIMMAVGMTLLFGLEGNGYAAKQVKINIAISASIVKKARSGKITYTGGWNPSQISVHYGDRVTLSLTSEDVDHGFSLPAFGVNAAIPAQETVTVNFVANKRGTFPFKCNVFCGPYHPLMVGKLIVLPAKS